MLKPLRRLCMPAVFIGLYHRQRLIICKHNNVGIVTEEIKEVRNVSVLFAEWRGSPTSWISYSGTPVPMIIDDVMKLVLVDIQTSSILWIWHHNRWKFLRHKNRHKDNVRVHFVRYRLRWILYCGNEIRGTLGIRLTNKATFYTTSIWASSAPTVNYPRTWRLQFFRGEVVSKLHTYLVIYGAEPFLRNRQLRSYSGISQHFMEHEGSLPCSQEPSTGPCHEPGRSSPEHLILSL
jgi:hypothetical protein